MLTTTKPRAKQVNQLYFRDLSPTEITIIQQLMAKFSEKTGTAAARKALFSYLELEKENFKLKEGNKRLNNELNKVTIDYKNLQAEITNYFSLREETEIALRSIHSNLPRKKKL